MSLPGPSSAARQGLVTHFLRRAAQQRAGEQRAWGQVSLQKSLGCAERPNLARRDPTRSQGPAATPPSCWVSPRDELGVARGGGGRRAWPARYHLSVTLSVSAGRSSGGEPREELHRLSAGRRSVTGWEAVPLAPPRLRLRPVFSAGAGREGLCSDTPHTAPLSPLRVTRSPPEGMDLIRSPGLFWPRAGRPPRALRSLLGVSTPLRRGLRGRVQSLRWGWRGVREG